MKCYLYCPKYFPEKAFELLATLIRIEVKIANTCNKFFLRKKVLNRDPCRTTCHQRFFSMSPVYRVEIQETKPKWWNINLYRSRLFCTMRTQQSIFILFGDLYHRHIYILDIGLGLVWNLKGWTHFNANYINLFSMILWFLIFPRMSPPYNIVSIPSHDSCIPEKQFAVQDEYTRHIIEGVRDCRS